MSTIKVGEMLSLPAAHASFRIAKSGLLMHHLGNELQSKVKSVRSVERSQHGPHTLITLETDQTLAWKDSGKLLLGEELLGVIRLDTNGRLKWTQHRDIDTRFSRRSVDDYKALTSEVFKSWESAFLFSSDPGLRHQEFASGLHRHQIGALHAIGAHWSLDDSHATIVMPTGTGKSDTMVGAMVAYSRGTTLVVVPNSALRKQTIGKFYTLGLLRELGHLKRQALNPVVGVLTARINSVEDLLLFESCNVVITTMAMIAQGTSTGFGPAISSKISQLFLDEAHHVPSNTWAAFRHEFEKKPVLQFTATPFRRDKKPLDGRPIFKYSLSTAQKDGFFKQIEFHPVTEPDETKSDMAIARKTLQALRADLNNGFDHVVLARVSTKERAKSIFSIYEKLGSEFNPLLIYSGKAGAHSELEVLKRRESRLVVCVDMLGEGFDLPQLKIAAIHDSYKSLAILLQFIGRFTRTIGTTLGNASVIANSARPELASALEELYSEDADWNVLLRNYSSDAIKDYIESIKLLEDCEQIELASDKLQNIQVSHLSLKPKLSTVVYQSKSFRPHAFVSGLPGFRVPHKAWLNTNNNLLFFITAENPAIDWSTARSLLELRWHLYVVYFLKANNMMFIHSSDNSSLHSDLAEAIGGKDAQILNGEPIFRVFAGIKKLLLHNVGLKRRITGSSLRFSQHMGSDISEALNSLQTAASTKSNIYATGYEHGDRVNIGCSYKGRIWTREQGSLSSFIQWCNQMSAKLLDTAFDTTKLIRDALIYEEVIEFPDTAVLTILWPDELWRKTEKNVFFKAKADSTALFNCDIEVVSVSKQEFVFAVVANRTSAYSLKLLPDRKITVTHVSGPSLVLAIGRNEHDAAIWFAENPPEIHFVDGSQIDGALWIHPQQRKSPSIPSESFEVWDWKGVDLTHESMWQSGRIRTESIQYHVASKVKSEFDLIFDDDGKGESADLVAIKDEPERVHVALYHCKYSGAALSGSRVTDVMEVCAQATRSHKWKYRFDDLCTHLFNRERAANLAPRKTRFFSGSMQALRVLLVASRQKRKIEFSIIIVQPGISRSNVSIEQYAVLASAYAFLSDTIDVNLKVICSD